VRAAVPCHESRKERAARKVPRVPSAREPRGDDAMRTREGGRTRAPKASRSRVVASISESCRRQVARAGVEGDG